MPAVYNHSLEFCLYIGISCNGRRVQPSKGQQARRPKPASSRRNFWRESAACRETLQASAPNGHGRGISGQRNERSGVAGESVYIISHYVTRQAKREREPRPQGAGVVFSYGKVERISKKPFAHPPHSLFLLQSICPAKH